MQRLLETLKLKVEVFKPTLDFFCSHVIHAWSISSLHLQNMLSEIFINAEIPDITEEFSSRLILTSVRNLLLFHIGLSLTRNLVKNISRTIYDSLGQRYVWVFWLFWLIASLTLFHIYLIYFIVHWHDNSCRTQFNVYDDTSTIDFLLNTSHTLDSVHSGTFYTQLCSVSVEQCRTKKKQFISSLGKLNIHFTLHEQSMNHQWTTSHQRNAGS